MFGTTTGNLTAILYFFIFQLLGILLSFRVVKKHSFWFTVLMGSVIGSFALQWLPVLYAFFLGFTKMAHILALMTFILLATAACVKIKNPRSFSAGEMISDMKEPMLFILIPIYILTIIILNGHTIPNIDGALHSGQSTYGDMNMHLGFITSIAKQHMFPPEYSILPGTKLAYPFLSDSISSSLYLFGCSLRLAYLVPMYFALLQVFFGMTCVAKQLLFVFNKPYRGKIILAFLLFFFNGGFGFYYFINQGFQSENFKRIFTAFYETPTNYVSENIQWHNIICDMLIPQRATLFGWAILFPLLALLLKARKRKDLSDFLVCGVLAGGLVLIHTHSFLALGVLCAGFVLQDLCESRKNSKRWNTYWRTGIVIGFFAVMTFLSIIQHSDNPLGPNTILSLGIDCLAVFLGIFIYYTRKAWLADKQNSFQKLVKLWGCFLVVVLVLALPQLIGFTFQQAQGEQFVRGSFNWANDSDNYIMFYLKNLGIVFILMIFMLILGTKKQLQTILPACFLWVICEFILFQPNPYDNNKLLLVAYLFFCIGVADFIWETIPALAGKLSNRAKVVSQKTPSVIRIITVCLVTVLGTFGAVLTIGREYVSDYELYDSAYVNMCKWVEENTEPSDTFLTATNHNNAVASLTGRNIVCGSGSFLYYHGVDYAGSEADVKTMYEDPSQRDALLQKHNVNYIILGPWEWSSYNIPDLETMYNTYSVVYNEDNVVVLAV